MPLFKHDCKNCRFLGSTMGVVSFDHYIHEGGPLGPTLLARFSDEGPDYHAGPLRMIAPGQASPLGLALQMYRMDADVRAVDT